MKTTTSWICKSIHMMVVFPTRSIQKVWLPNPDPSTTSQRSTNSLRNLWSQRIEMRTMISWTLRLRTRRPQPPNLFFNSAALASNTSTHLQISEVQCQKTLIQTALSAPASITIGPKSSFPPPITHLQLKEAKVSHPNSLLPTGVNQIPPKDSWANTSNWPPKTIQLQPKEVKTKTLPRWFNRAPMKVNQSLKTRDCLTSRNQEITE